MPIQSPRELIARFPAKDRSSVIAGAEKGSSSPFRKEMFFMVGEQSAVVPLNGSCLCGGGNLGLGQ
jgi:hypothetical protein